MNATTNEARFAGFDNANEAAESTENSLLSKVLLRTAVFGAVLSIIAIAYAVCSMLVFPN